MESIVRVIVTLIEHLVYNASTYFLMLGLFFILAFVFIQFGATYFILALGITSILISFFRELNKLNLKR